MIWAAGEILSLGRWGGKEPEEERTLEDAIASFFSHAPKSLCSSGEIQAVTAGREQERDESHFLSRLFYLLRLLPQERMDPLMNKGFLPWGLVHGNETVRAWFWSGPSAAQGKAPALKGTVASLLAGDKGPST